ncbi:MAG TPA: outer membrane lipoprotein carrier protein LolA [bacterium]|nr:outer membrane lipoprotein carrier protein LolA [bacterium]
MASSNASRSASSLASGLWFALLLACNTAAQAPDATGPGRDEGAKDEPAPATAKELFRTFARLRGLSAKFTEEKHLSLLAVPLKSSGELHFLAPDHLARVVVAPEPSQVIISNRELRMRDAHGTEVIDLRQSDRVRLFVTSLMRVFQGDRAALTKTYDVRYARDPQDRTRWRLELTPKPKELRQILKHLILHGRGHAVTRIERAEPNGDRTITTITAVDTRREFTAAERKRLFAIEPKARPAK